MVFSKKYIVFISLFLFLATSFLFADDKTNKVATDVSKKTPTKIVISYFHTTYRCSTCNKIEALTKEAIETHFKTEIKNGSIEFHALNTDEPENKHYIKDYQLFTKSVIVSELQDGKQIRWKNLPKIWELVHKEDEFKEYIILEVSSFQEEQTINKGSSK